MIRLLIMLFCISIVAPIEISAASWNEYYQNTLSGNPQSTVVLAQKYFDHENRQPTFAVDLGCGTGRDTLFLLTKGWRVLAIDSELSAIEILLGRADENKNHLDTQFSLFSEMNLPDHIDLVNASFSLPFISPEDFASCWQNIVQHLAVDGRFSGQFFGEEDEWADDSSMTFHTLIQVEKLFQGHFIIEYLQIEKGLKPTASGEMKHWHIYHVIAKKIK